jgi:hypothetical protein
MPENGAPSPEPPPEVVQPVRNTASSDFNLEANLNGAARVIRDVMIRQLNDGAAQTSVDPILDVLETVVNGIKHGTDISAQEERITKVILNQEQRAELIDNIMLTHDFDRLVQYAKARKVLEDFLLKSAIRGDLSVTEALAFMRIVQTESETLQNRVKSGAHSVKDIVQMIQKVDYTIQRNEQDLAKKYKNTSPQSREVMRRLGHKLNKLGKDKANKTAIED